MVVQQKLLSVIAGAILLAGCSGPGAFVTPVEERDVTPRSGLNQPGAVIPVEPSTGVKVAPIYDAPSFAPTQQSSIQRDTPVRSQVKEQLPINQKANSAVVALLSDAQQAANRGDLASAETQVERALRIAPRDPQVYLHLASIKRRQLNYLQAEQVALRGVAVSAGLPDYQRLMWRELAKIREMNGDAAGAAQARAEASR
ncbi:MAG: hypothetical protein RL143_1283 [Pseudomonadota bacterium]